MIVVWFLKCNLNCNQWFYRIWAGIQNHDENNIENVDRLISIEMKWKIALTL